MYFCIKYNTLNTMAMKIGDVVTLHFLLTDIYGAEKWKITDEKESDNGDYVFVVPVDGAESAQARWMRTSNFMEHPIYERFNEK